jgi:hypothetical protein
MPARAGACVRNIRGDAQQSRDVNRGYSCLGVRSYGNTHLGETMAKPQEILDKFVAEKAADEKLTREEMADIRWQARKLKDVNINLAVARMAAAHMIGKFGLVANRDLLLDSSAEKIYDDEQEKANRAYQKAQEEATSLDDLAWATMEFDAAMARAEAKSKAAWDNADRCVYGGLRQTDDWQYIAGNGGVHNLRDMRTIAGLAEGFGCGNCGELSARTFMFLFNLGIRPLDFASLDGADHALVVIGRNGKPDNDPVGRKWGKDAVICDPWAAGVLIPLGPHQLGPHATFGMAFAAYTADLLEPNMKRIFPGFKGVTIAHREV